MLAPQHQHKSSIASKNVGSCGMQSHDGMKPLPETNRSSGWIDTHITDIAELQQEMKPVCNLAENAVTNEACNSAEANNVCKVKKRKRLKTMRESSGSGVTNQAAGKSQDEIKLGCKLPRSSPVKDVDIEHNLWLDVWQSIEDTSSNHSRQIETHQLVQYQHDPKSENDTVVATNMAAKHPRLRSKTNPSTAWTVSVNSSTLALERRPRLRSKQAPNGAWLVCGTSPTALCTKRRRLNGKQPPPAWAVTLDGMARRRSKGKQLPRQQSPVFPVEPRGHYDVLLLQRSATEAEIRKAYRLRALATHPDKGGNAADFFRVSTAFEVLSDKSQRDTYDRDLDLRGFSDGTVRAGVRVPPARRTSCHRANMEHHGAARVAQVLLLASSPPSWKDELTKLPNATLDAILAQLRQKKSSRGSSALDNHSKIDPESIAKCIRHNRKGYSVRVTWASLTLNTGHTKLLDEAVDWHIALIWVKGVAQSRLQRLDKLSSEDPLIHDEVLQVFELAPSIQLSFTMCFRMAGKSVYTPTTQDLGLAMDFRRRYIAICDQRDSLHDVELQKREMVRQVMQRKKHLRICEDMLAKAIVALRASRSGLLVALTQPRAQSAICNIKAQAGLRACVKSLKARGKLPSLEAKGGA